MATNSRHMQASGDGVIATVTIFCFVLLVSGPFIWTTVVGQLPANTPSDVQPVEAPFVLSAEEVKEVMALCDHIPASDLKPAICARTRQEAK